MTRILLQFGQERLTAQHQRDILVWGAILIVIVIAGGLGIALMRRYLVDAARASDEDAGLTLADLRAMHQRGELTDQEFESAKSRIIARAKGKPGNGPSPPTTS